MADEDVKPLSQIELEDGEIEDEEVEPEVEPINNESLNDNQFKLNPNNDEEPDKYSTSLDKNLPHRKRHIESDESSDAWKKSRIDEESKDDDTTAISNDAFKSPFFEESSKPDFDNKSNVLEKWDGYNSDEEKVPTTSPVAASNTFVDEIPKSPVETVKWSYDSDDEATSSTKPNEPNETKNNDGNKNSWGRGSSPSNTKSSWGRSDSPDKNKSSWGKSDSPNDTKSSRGRNDSPDKNKNSWGRNDSLEKNKNSWGRNDSPDKNKSSWGRNDSPEKNKSSWGRSDSPNNNKSSWGRNQSPVQRNNWGGNSDNKSRSPSDSRSGSRGNRWNNNRDDNKDNNRGGWRGNRGGWRGDRRGDRNDNWRGRGNNRGFNNRNSWQKDNNDNDNSSYSHDSNKNSWGNKESSPDKGGFKQDSPILDSKPSDFENKWGDKDSEIKEEKARSRSRSVEKWGGYESDDEPAKTTEKPKPFEEKKQMSEELVDDAPKPISMCALSPVETAKWGYDSDDDVSAPKPSEPVKTQSFFPNDFKKEAPISQAEDTGNKFEKWGGCGDDEEEFGKWGADNTSSLKPTTNTAWGTNNDDAPKWGSSPKRSEWGNNDSSPQKGGGGYNKWDNNNSDSEQSNSFGGRGRGGYRRNDDGGRGGGRGRGGWNNRGGGGGKKSVCKYFAMGSCRHGDNCTFLHESAGGGSGGNGGNNNNSYSNNNTYSNNNNSYSNNSNSYSNNSNSYSNNSNSYSNNNNSYSNDSHNTQQHRKEASIKELCKFYEHQDCYKRGECNYMHEEFPCKLYHAGSKMCPSGDSCKYSHSSLTPESKELLERYLDEKIDERKDKGNCDSMANHEDQRMEKFGRDDFNRNMMEHPDPNFMDMHQRFPVGQDVMRMPYRYGYNPMMRFPEMQMDMAHRQRFMFDRYPYPVPSPNRMFQRGVQRMMMPNVNGIPYPVPPLMQMNIPGAKMDMMGHGGMEAGPDPYIGNLAQIVTTKDSLKRDTQSPKRLVDILDPSVQQCDDDDYAPRLEADFPMSVAPPLASPIKTKSPEVPPGTYVPSTNINAAQANVRLGCDQMMYGGYEHPNMMELINMSAFHYYHNPPESINFERVWKAVLLEVPVKIPYPLMNIETCELPHKYTDPRLRGHPSVINPSASTSADDVTSPLQQLSVPDSLDESSLISPLDTGFAFANRMNSLDSTDSSGNKGALNRSYLLDPRFKRKKAAAGTPPSQAGLENLEFDSTL